MKPGYLWQIHAACCTHFVGDHRYIYFKRIQRSVALPRKEELSCFRIFLWHLLQTIPCFRFLGFKQRNPLFPLSLVGENREADLSRERCRAVWSATGKEACAESPEGLEELRERLQRRWSLKSIPKG